MYAKKVTAIVVVVFVLTCSFYSISISSNEAKALEYNEVSNEFEKGWADGVRAVPKFDYIIGSDYLPHFRVFFWVNKDAEIYSPYADKDVKTNVSEHGDIGNWSVIETNNTNKDEKLVFVYVPKTFVILQGIGFENKVHLRYK